MAGTASTNQGAREVYGAVSLYTPNGDSAMDESADAVKVTGTVALSGSPSGSTTASAPTTATIGVASATVITSNASRKGLVLTNTSTGGQRISLHMANGTAVLDSGVTLWPGDAMVMAPNLFTTAQINGIASAASGTVGVQELT